MLIAFNLIVTVTFRPYLCPIKQAILIIMTVTFHQKCSINTGQAYFDQSSIYALLINYCGLAEAATSPTTSHTHTVMWHGWLAPAWVILQIALQAVGWDSEA